MFVGFEEALDVQRKGSGTQRENQEIPEETGNGGCPSKSADACHNNSTNGNSIHNGQQPAPRQNTTVMHRWR